MRIVSPVEVFARFRCLVGAQTFENLGVLFRGAVLSPRHRTVTGCLLSAWPWVTKHWTVYENTVRRAKLPMLQFAKKMLAIVASMIPPNRTVDLVLDESLVRRYGPYVMGIGMHRDAVQSSKTNHIFSPGHKWVVLAVVLSLPHSNRALALPICSLLYTPKKIPSRNHTPKLYRRHRTPGELAILLIRLVAKWLNGRKFRVFGDGAYATHELSGLLSPHGRFRDLRQGRLISRFRLDAPTYASVTKQKRLGRPRVIGNRLPTPQIYANRDRGWTTLRVLWYGSTTRKIKIISRKGLWYKCGHKPTKIRWVLVRDLEGKRSDEVFYSTDTTLSPRQIVECYVKRWSIETTFQEMREHLGLETLKGRSSTTIMRSVPMVLSIYSYLLIWYAKANKGPDKIVTSTPWYPKDSMTFSDVLTHARKAILAEAVFQPSGHPTCEFKVGRGAETPIKCSKRVKKRAA